MLITEIQVGLFRGELMEIVSLSLLIPRPCGSVEYADLNSFIFKFS